jgi:hypothetical protein
LIKGICRGNPLTVARQAISHSLYHKQAIRVVGMLVKKELKTMCSDHVNSVLKSNEPTRLQHFSLMDVVKEANIHAPVLFALLSIAFSKPEKTNTLGYIIATLCQLRSKKHNLHLKLIAFILFSGHCSKQVYERLQKINLCVSHSTMYRMLEKLGIGHDSEVLKWKDELEKRVLSTVSGTMHVSQKSISLNCLIA